MQDFLHPQYDGTKMPARQVAEGCIAIWHSKKTHRMPGACHIMATVQSHDQTPGFQKRGVAGDEFNGQGFRPGTSLTKSPNFRTSKPLLESIEKHLPKLRGIIQAVCLHSGVLIPLLSEERNSQRCSKLQPLQPEATQLRKVGCGLGLKVSMARWTAQALTTSAPMDLKRKTCDPKQLPV